MKSILIAASLMFISTFLIASDLRKEYEALDNEIARIKAAGSSNACVEIEEVWNKFMLAHSVYAKGYDLVTTIYGCGGRTNEQVIDMLKAKWDKKFEGKPVLDLSAEESAEAEKLCMLLAAANFSTFKTAEGEKYLQKFEFLNPLSSVPKYYHAFAEYMKGNYDKALDYVNQYIRIDAYFDKAHALKKNIMNAMGPELQKIHMEIDYRTIDDEMDVIKKAKLPDKNWCAKKGDILMDFNTKYFEYAKPYEASIVFFECGGTTIKDVPKELLDAAAGSLNDFKAGERDELLTKMAVKECLMITSLNFYLGKNDEAAKYLAQAKQYGLNWPAMYYYDAYEAYKKNDYEKGIASIKEYIKYDPYFTGAKNLLSTMEGLKGIKEYGKIRDARKTAAPKTPNAQPAGNEEAKKLVKEAEAAMKAGELDKASDLVTKALELEPGNREYMGLQRVIMLKKKHANKRQP